MYRIQRFCLLWTFIVAAGCSVDVDITDRTKKFLSVDFTKATEFEFDENYVEFADDKLKLKPLSLVFSGETFLPGNLSGLTLVGSRLSIDTEASVLESDPRQILPDQSSKLIGYWSFDGNLQDLSGNDNHGASAGDPSFSGDRKIGTQSLYFDGTGDWVDITEATSFKPSEFTINVWTKIDPAEMSSGEIAMIFDKGFLTNTGYGLFKTTSGRIMGYLATSNGGGVVLSPENISTSWQMISLVYSHSQSLLTLYVDGDPVSSLSASVDLSTIISTEAATIGACAKAGCVSREFFGRIDDVALWGTSLSAGDLKFIYNRQKQKYSGSLDSEIIDTGNEAFDLKALAWATPLAFGKELVGDVSGQVDADSETSANYSEHLGSLGTQMVGYWKFQNKDYDGSPNEVEDFSGNGNHGNFTGEGGENIVSGAISSGFAMGTEHIEVPVATAPSTSETLTLSFWFRIQDNLNTTFSSIVKNRNNGVRGWQIDAGPSANQMRLRIDTSAGTNQIFLEASSAGGALFDGQWHMLSMVLDNGNGAFFMDGKPSNTFTYNHGTGLDRGGAVGEFFIAGPALYNGRAVDEVTLWHRDLSPEEIQQLYRRAANRIKLQVRTCVDASCQCRSLSVSPAGTSSDCDGDGLTNDEDSDDSFRARFAGLGGDGRTSFSEDFNRLADNISFVCDTNTSDTQDNICVGDEISLSGSPTSTSPLFSFDDYLEALRPRTNRYIQYRVQLEADENTACGGEPCLPELASLDLNPGGETIFYGQVQTITSLKPLPFVYIRSAKIEADSCASFQVSPNGSDFYVWSESLEKWVVPESETSGTAASQVAENLKSFPEQFGSGGLIFKAFLTTDTTTSCEIQSFEIETSESRNAK